MLMQGGREGRKEIFLAICHKNLATLSTTGNLQINCCLSVYILYHILSKLWKYVFNTVGVLTVNMCYGSELGQSSCL